MHVPSVKPISAPARPSLAPAKPVAVPVRPVVQPRPGLKTSQRARPTTPSYIPSVEETPESELLETHAPSSPSLTEQAGLSFTSATPLPISARPATTPARPVAAPVIPVVQPRPDVKTPHRPRPTISRLPSAEKVAEEELPETLVPSIQPVTVSTRPTPTSAKPAPTPARPAPTPARPIAAPVRPVIQPRPGVKMPQQFSPTTPSNIPSVEKFPDEELPETHVPSIQPINGAVRPAPTLATARPTPTSIRPAVTFVRPVVQPRPGVKAPLRPGVKVPLRVPIATRPVSTPGPISRPTQFPSAVISTPRAPSIQEVPQEETIDETLPKQPTILDVRRPTTLPPSTVSPLIKPVSASLPSVEEEYDYDEPRKPAVSSSPASLPIRPGAKLPPAQVISRKPLPVSPKPLTTPTRPQPRPVSIPSLRPVSTAVGPDLEDYKETLPKSPVVEPVRPRPSVKPISTPARLSPESASSGIKFRPGVKAPQVVPKRPLVSATISSKPVTTPVSSDKPQVILVSTTPIPGEEDYEEESPRKPEVAPTRPGLKTPLSQTLHEHLIPPKPAAVQPVRPQIRPLATPTKAITSRPAVKPTSAPAIDEEEEYEEEEYEATRKPIVAPKTKSPISPQPAAGSTRRPIIGTTVQPDEYDYETPKKPITGQFQPVSIPSRPKVKTPPAQSLPRPPVSVRPPLSTTLRPLPRPAPVPVSVPPPQPALEENEDYDDTLPKKSVTPLVRPEVKTRQELKSGLKMASKPGISLPTITTAKPALTEEYDYLEEIVTSRPLPDQSRVTESRPTTPVPTTFQPQVPVSRTTLRPIHSIISLSHKPQENVLESDYDEESVTKATTGTVGPSRPKVSTTGFTIASQPVSFEKTLQPVSPTKIKASTPGLTYSPEPVFGQRLAPPRGYMTNFIIPKMPIPKPISLVKPLPRKPALAEANEIEESKRGPARAPVKPISLAPAIVKNGPPFPRMAISTPQVYNVYLLFLLYI